MEREREVSAGRRSRRYLAAQPSVNLPRLTGTRTAGRSTGRQAGHWDLRREDPRRSSAQSARQMLDGDGGESASGPRAFGISSWAGFAVGGGLELLTARLHPDSSG